MNEQISFCLADEVAPYFQHQCIIDYCHLIDEKASKGLKYHDLKEQLLHWILKTVDITNESDAYNIYRRAYEFAKYY